MPAPRVLMVYGTRPEAIKMAPLVRAVEADPGLGCRVVVTGQHREMLRQVNGIFGIEPDHDLDIMGHGQTLAGISARILDGLDPLLVQEAPAAVVVQGDTTTSTMAAVAAFYRSIPVVHLEAGLRSGDLTSPFPEEANRKMTGQISALHLAPTASARRNLLREGIDPESILVTGNTVVDALLETVAQDLPVDDPQLAEVVAGDDPIVLVTVHRRESWGAAMDGIGRAVGRLADRFPDHRFVLPLHRNPVVREAILPHTRRPNVVVLEPLGYSDFTRLLARATLALSDSGGVQEEGPSLGTPVLVLRDTTERPEAVDAGTVRLVGTDPDRIVAAASHLLRDRAAHDAMARAINPYGDGHAAQRAVAGIRHLIGRGPRPAEFSPTTPETS